MSKKLEITSCDMCPNAQFRVETMNVMCAISPVGEREFRRESLQDSGTGIWSECPLEEYETPVVRWTEKPVINRHAIKNSFGIPKTSAQQLWEETVQEMTEPEPVAPAKTEMNQLMAFLDGTYSSPVYFAPDGNMYDNHPSAINQFIHQVKQSRGNIISIQPHPEQNRYSILYEVPVGTYPISI